jgi:CheY-like chemotaxis protein
MTPNPTLPEILVVDDEPLVREIAVDILSELGLIPHEARDAEEALFILAAHPNISMLFTDIKMPGGMDGMELAERVRKIRPHVGIIITSGMRHMAKVPMPDQGTFLPKPYRAEQLTKMVSQKLAAIY